MSPDYTNPNLSMFILAYIDLGFHYISIITQCGFVNGPLLDLSACLAILISPDSFKLRSYSRRQHICQNQFYIFLLLYHQMHVIVFAKQHISFAIHFCIYSDYEILVDVLFGIPAFTPRFCNSQVDRSFLYQSAAGYGIVHEKEISCAYGGGLRRGKEVSVKRRLHARCEIDDVNISLPAKGACLPDGQKGTRADMSLPAKGGR